MAPGDQPIALLGKYSAFDLVVLKIDVARVQKMGAMPYTEIAKKLTPKATTKELLKRVY